MNEEKKILIGTSAFAQVDPLPLEILEKAGYRVVMNPHGRKLTKEELAGLLPGVVGLIAGLEPLTRDVLKQSQLRVISRCGAGISNVDLEAARELGIQVCSTPDAPTTAVAELTVAMMINLLRHVCGMNRSVHEGKWVKKTGVQLEGKTVLIVGLGRIGRKVASLLKPFGVRLLSWDVNSRASMEGVNPVPLSEALPQADIITLHASGEGEILGKRELAQLKKGVLLLNAGRGGLVNEAGLCEALDRGVVAGAWLDTFETEPYSGPLIRYDRVLLTPHAGSYTAECRSRMEREAAENLLSALTRQKVSR